MSPKGNGDEAKHLRKQAGAYIAKLRTEKRLSQLDLSRKLGYDYYSFISQVENGVVRVPPNALGAWARALGVDMGTFALTLLRYYEPGYFEAIKSKLAE